MEKEGYRENLAFLTELFPGRAVLCVKEAATVLGVSQKTLYEQSRRVCNSFPVKKIGGKVVVPITALASWMV